MANMKKSKGNVLLTLTDEEYEDLCQLLRFCGDIYNFFTEFDDRLSLHGALLKATTSVGTRSSPTRA